MMYQTIQSALAHCFRERNKNEIAIEHKDQRITYQELEIAAQFLVKKLKTLGARKGTQIGVLAEDRSAVIAAAIAVFNLGAVFVPLDPSFPVNRLLSLSLTADLNYILMGDDVSLEIQEAWSGESVRVVEVNMDDLYGERAQAQTYLIHSKVLHGESHKVGSNGQAEPLIDRLKTYWDRALYHPDDPIYFYFTTGTTGKPKPVVGRNIGLMHFIDWENRTVGFDADTRVSQLTSPCHDPYLRDIFTTLTAGGTICIPDSRHTILSPFEYKTWINQAGVNVMHCTPTMFRNLCNGGLTPEDFPDLKWVLIAGEQLLAKDLKKWYVTFGERIQLVNLYGPTETTLAKLFHLVTLEDMKNGWIPIGKPMNDTTVQVLSPSMEPSPQGEIGELYIKTAYRSLGYYKNDTLNQEVFIADPADPDGGEVIYKTGDYVRMLPDQSILFVGRKDRKVKVRGKQLDLGEVEKELESFPGVNGCIVKMHTSEDHIGSEYLVAYYISEEAISNDELTAYLKDNLPDYMVPRHFIGIESIPMNVNGKIDLSALPDPGHKEDGSPDDGAISLNGEDSSPDDGIPSLNGEVGSPIPDGTSIYNNEIEDKLLEIWKEILDKEEVGTEEVFMEIGGDSLGIMQLITRVSSDFDFELTLWQVFDDLTIQKLAELISEGDALT